MINKPEQNNTVAFYTFGCRLNQSETAVVQKTFEDGGFRVVDHKEPADIVVVNTCTVTENGDRDTRRFVNRVNRLNPRARIALIGCQAQIQKKALASLPNVYWVVGNARKMDLLAILKANAEPEDPLVVAPTIDREAFVLPAAGIDPHHTRANIKIQDGCDFFCSFCEIPYARGRARSRKFDDILLEAGALVAAGHRELVITGINVGTYKNNRKTILDVIDALEQIEGLARIRISSIEPTTIPARLIEKMAGPSKLCRHLHVPLQSGSDRVLKGMKRKYTSAQFYGFIRWAAQAVPGLCIGTDVIVGFPGETDEQFDATVRNLRDWPVHYFHVFSYSERKIAQSRKLRGAVGEQTIARRSATLRALSARKRTVFYRSLINSEQKVLFEQSRDAVWSGLTDNYVRVKTRSTDDLKNRVRKVRCTGNDHKAVYGNIIR